MLDSPYELESELFGQVGGRVTGACRGKPGLLELAPNGTVLLEGVAEMSSRIQDLLFRFLETGELQRLGGDLRHSPPDIRLMTATSRDLHAEIGDGFREDLYYRLSVIHVHVPPLRSRVSDVALLVDHFLDWHAQEHGGARLEVTAATLDALVADPWPGNVRELQDVIEGVARKASGRIAQIDDLPQHVLPSAMPLLVAAGGGT